MKIDYRALARQAVERCQALLAVGHDEGLRYASLELRLAMEALTYDRAQAYIKELPLDALAKWQPQKVMDALLEIDPTAGTTSTIRVGSEPAPGVPPETMFTLGTDVVFGLRDIKRHYHAVGSFLHMPTMHQLRQGKGWDPAKTRKHIEDAARALAASLNSPVWNSTLGKFANFECMRCEKPMHKRVSADETKPVAVCIYCNAPHAGRLLDDGRLFWEPMTRRVKCPTPDCTHTFDIWQDEIKAGTCWSCPKCHKGYRIEYGIVPDDHPADDAAVPEK